MPIEALLPGDYSPGVGPNAVNLADIPRLFCFLGFPVETVKRGLLSLLYVYVPDACAPNRGSFFRYCWRSRGNCLFGLIFTRYFKNRGVFILDRIRPSVKNEDLIPWFSKENRHDPLKGQHEILCSKLRGFYQYFGVRSNYKVLEVVYEYAKKAWRRWLGRRDRDGYISHEKFRRILRTFPLPRPRIVHNI